ncbi:MAG: hypothetical protein A3G76_10090 [Acidobacteria bacterium RIFCSPLOWO2_12_FULL_65_11]|nr:MAG: hypothetical protein A3H95_04770 [Acidobacteria bacterium RIFCSPLOWO2_02_FULL_64_15]OFW31478.1 MAG: hypothetical protein A3G76_10090 [Acidobacteria bacterium RIFCSPLOWO2_12_FULL_65_11]
MKPVWWMVGASALSWLAVTALTDRETSRDVLFGMVGPLGVATSTWVLMERAYRRSPMQLTSVMVGAFVGKMVFFGAYVAIMIRGVAVRPVPFMASFTGYFIGLYVIEALYLKRLFAK